MTSTPTKLARSGENAIVIEWSDGARREYSFRELRDACPCATCREKRSQGPAPANLLPVLSAAEARPLTVSARWSRWAITPIRSNSATGTARGSTRSTCCANWADPWNKNLCRALQVLALVKFVVKRFQADA